MACGVVTCMQILSRIFRLDLQITLDLVLLLCPSHFVGDQHRSVAQLGSGDPAMVSTCTGPLPARPGSRLQAPGSRLQAGSGGRAGEGCHPV
jgi:hypothetical protein